MELDPNVWGPHYWFVLHTIALCYPLYPNDVTKKKYYEFIQNFPLMIPVEKIGNNFSILLDKFPVTPYLDSRESFQKWIHFIHNKVNEQLGLPELSFSESIDKYYHNYKPKDLLQREKLRRKEKYIFLISVMMLSGLIFAMYKK
jgi:hypothetical protein